MTDTPSLAASSVQCASFASIPAGAGAGGALGRAAAVGVFFLTGGGVASRGLGALALLVVSICSALTAT